jgi:hypothetical protein
MECSSQSRFKSNTSSLTASLRCSLGSRTFAEADFDNCVELGVIDDNGDADDGRATAPAAAAVEAEEVPLPNPTMRPLAEADALVT